MKIKQVKLLYSDECTNTFYSFQAFVNDTLAKLSSDEDVSDITIEHYSKDFIVIGYLLEVNKENL